MRQKNESMSWNTNTVNIVFDYTMYENQELLEMKRSYSEVRDDVTICLKYPLLRKWTRELSFQPVQMIENTRLDAWLALSRPAQASCIMYLISSFRICACMCAVTSVMSNSLRPLGL